jgi:hypothetical protein
MYPHILVTQPLIQHDTNHYPSDGSDRNGLRLFSSAATVSWNPYNLTDKAPDINTMSYLSLQMQTVT